MAGYRLDLDGMLRHRPPWWSVNAPSSVGAKRDPNSSPIRFRVRASHLTSSDAARASLIFRICSGSIRIHTSGLQKKVFRLLGYDDAQIKQLFGHMLEAFDFGAPPHGGIAPGIDRIVMLLAGEENIREVVAFPKNQAAVDLTFNAPASVTEEQLAELHIRLREEE